MEKPQIQYPVECDDPLYSTVGKTTNLVRQGKVPGNEAVEPLNQFGILKEILYSLKLQ